MPPAAERIATILRWLNRAVAARIAVGLPAPLIVLIFGRISRISQQITRLAARIRAGRYTPRRSAPRRPPASRRARRASPLPHRAGWLLRMVPEAAAFRAHLETLLQDPETAALLAAAPAAMARPIRSLCWMLLLPPPAIPAQTRPTPPQAAPAQSGVPATAPPTASPAAPQPAATPRRSTRPPPRCRWQAVPGAG